MMTFLIAMCFGFVSNWALNELWPPPPWGTRRWVTTTLAKMVATVAMVIAYQVLTIGI